MKKKIIITLALTVSAFIAAKSTHIDNPIKLGAHILNTPVITQYLKRYYPKQKTNPILTAYSDRIKKAEAALNGKQSVILSGKKVLIKRPISHDEYRTYISQMETYLKAIVDAIHASPDEETDTLVSLTPKNKHIQTNRAKTHVLVTSWMSMHDYNKYIKSNFAKEGVKTVHPRHLASIQQEGYERTPAWWGTVWVSIPHETQTFIKNYLAQNKNATPQQLKLRLIQYLGLAPEFPGEEQDRVFVLMWVKPADFIRPCVNNNLFTNRCEADYGPFLPPAPFGDIFTLGGVFNQSYINWFTTNRNKTYVNLFPWTGLGYTFDWGSDFENEVPGIIPEKGASEFIVRPQEKVFIQGDPIKTEEFANFTLQLP